MTLHKLSAGRGTGYEYLTRQLALDSTEKGTTPPAHYYAAKGETPGHWVGSGRVGSGLVGVDGVKAGDTVTAEGSHPLTGQPLGRRKIYGTDGVDGFPRPIAPITSVRPGWNLALMPG